MINNKELEKLLENLPSTVRLVAVSKFKPDESIMEAYKYGLRDFGENRPQELSKKMEQLPGDIKWHFIGHLQTNKIKLIIDKVHLIHSVDSEKLLLAINNEAQKRGITVNCLLQVYIATEESKQGLDRDELFGILARREQFSNIRICGLMGMASFTHDLERVGAEFAGLKELFDMVRKENPSISDVFCELSMGMSGDYKVAVQHGSTIVRIGSTIFGDRT